MHVKGSPHVVSFSADSTRVTAIGDSRHLDVWDPTVDSAPFFVGLDISFRWLPGTHTAVYGGSDGQAALYDTGAGGPTRRQPAVYADTGVGDVHIATFNGKARALPRLPLHRPDPPWSAYPLDPADWLADACSSSAATSPEPSGPPISPTGPTNRPAGRV